MLSFVSYEDYSEAAFKLHLDLKLLFVTLNYKV